MGRKIKIVGKKWSTVEVRGKRKETRGKETRLDVM